MSLYNIINGVKPCTFFIAPLVVGHPQENVGRFRDCFLIDDDKPEYNNHIFIYTRMGGGNRKDYNEEIEKLQNNEFYVEDYDDDFDSTYATFVFKIPEKFINDMELYKAGELYKTSAEYQNIILNTFPIIKDKLSSAFHNNNHNA